MKKFEYKFVKEDVKIGFSQTKKLVDVEKEWNELGKDGWQFCKEGNGCIIFMREGQE